ncbi:uncharacterized protein LOC130970832 isoform X2 [Arachis stenosperma]|uniref:uncharacterized protein LOC130970832 isoform X2 n=1 Tax=Arachis stenosperma TaxID=217475 RepID=UPI0025ACB872|nr:uncharacterized protein LOC130970832 isoform X2 [Arachis stenosperma]
MKTKVRLSKSLDREATLAETFKYTHTLKENKVRFVYQQSQNHYRDWRPQLNGLSKADGSAALVVDLDAVWRKTASVLYKNRVYGMESFFASSLPPRH